MDYDLSRVEAVIFDLDGTLINSAPDVRLSLNYALSFYSNQAITIDDDIYELIGHGVRVMFERACAKIGIYLTNLELQDAIHIYLEYYQANPIVGTYLYPHVVELLCKLENAGIRMGICTNKPSVMTNLILDKLHLKHFFEVISSGDEVKNPKPHGDHLFDILKQLHIDANHAVMIGDSDVDKVAAENAGIPFIGVRYGYAGMQFTSQYMISNLFELLGGINSIRRYKSIT